MSYWKNPTVNLGIIQAGKAKKIHFQALPNIPEIAKITPYCGCTTSSYDKKKKELVITYSNSSIPNQVQGPQSVTKRIDIQYVDGNIEVLTIKAIKTR